MAKTVVIYYSLGGCTKKVAEIIAEITKAEIIEIEMEDPYSKVGAYTRGSFDLLKKRLPVLKNFFDLKDAETVYLGGPVWFYTVPPPLRSLVAVDSFIDSIYGKKIIPFCTDGGNKGTFFEDMEDLFLEGDFKQGKEFKHIRKYKTEDLKAEIEAWIKENQDLGKH